MGKDSIEIAVRVRPFAPHEEGQDCIVSMSGNSVQLTDPHSGNSDKYSYNHAFWSHDSKQGRKKFMNSDLFGIVGTKMLSNAYEGYNSTVFAYGQTGSGKSYSIEGSPDDKGLLQRIWESLFDKKTELEDSQEGEIIVNASYLEIYNEQLKDLLDSKDKQLKIFATKQGILVKNLSKILWENFNDILKLLEDGKKMRVVGATNMNKQSSRSHAVFTLFITYKEGKSDGSKKKIKNSEMHIVDLAGSERQSKTQATGDRLKEGSSINKSLTYLGIVIEKLSTAKGNKNHIPYRNSQLTYLLSESLGGNSKTIMIAAISPAAFNYEETTSTLKFAERVACIQTITKANVAEEENLRAALATELEQLKQELMELEMSKTMTMTNFGKSIEDDEAKKAKRAERAEKKALLEAEIERQREMIQVAESDFEDARINKANLEKARNALFEEVGLSSAKLGEALDVEEGTPYLLNVSDDPTLAGWLIFYVQEGETIVGSSKGDVDILIRGLGIQGVHCSLHNTNNDTVELVVEGTARTLVNGWLVLENKKLKHWDRLVFGHGNAWKIMIPNFDDDLIEHSLSLDYSGIMFDRLNSNAVQPTNARRYLKELKERLGGADTKVFADKFAKCLDLIDEANEYSRYRYKNIPDEKNNVYFTLEVMEDVMDYQNDEPDIAIRMRLKETDQIVALWDYK